MFSKTTILFLLIWSMSCNAQRIASKPEEERSRVVELPLNDFDEEYDDVMEGLTERPPDSEIEHEPEEDGENKEENTETNEKEKEYFHYQMGEISSYLDQLRRAMEKAFRRKVEETLDRNNTYATEKNDREEDGENEEDDPSNSPNEYSHYQMGEISSYLDGLRSAIEKAFRLKVEETLDRNDTYGNNEREEDGENEEGNEKKSKKYDLSNSPKEYSHNQMGEIASYLDLLKGAMEKAFRRKVEETLDRNDTYVRETDDEVDVKGQKYHVHKSIIQGNDSSVLIEEVEAEPNRKKRSNWFAEEANDAKSTDP